MKDLNQEELNALVVVLRESLSAIGLDHRRSDIAARNQAMALVGAYRLEPIHEVREKDEI